MATRITSKGQVTIPKKVREFIGVGPGSAVEFELDADGRVVLVKAAGPRRASPFARVRGRATVKVRTEASMEVTRGRAWGADGRSQRPARQERRRGGRGWLSTGRSR